jgi:UPF0042 nucleotide-binding protein
MIDARFIPNPYFISELNQLNGKDPRVRQFVKKWPETQEFLDKYIHLLDYLIPLYEKEGRSYLTLAVGCTGGKHRSVSIAEEIYDHLKNQNRETSLIHRDIERLQ